LELSSSENPILIDQPEDNLDNRTIYDLLCQMVKTKKKKRQIIIVTHNANLVVNTDAENIIVANQEGQDLSSETSGHRTKFEYINGPIELSFKNGRSRGILTKVGIKQHICDILEGGSEAFKLREQKYKED
jgi:ABC-type lipoprotein export system ATPase subunit